MDIDHLLRLISEDPEKLPPEIRDIFTLLVKSTLEFRDRKHREFGIVLTVEDVKTALEWFMDFIRSGHLPKTDHLLRQELFEIWIRAIRRAIDTPEPQ
ncbi:MAG: hypothetical protein AB1659_08435 [Thermodesulfobacteriota bacterium]